MEAIYWRAYASQLRLGAVGGAADLITSWSHWLDMPRRVGDRMGAIIGSRPGEVAVHDNTTLNIFQAVHMALGLRPDRKVVSVSPDDFPSDRYVVEGIAHDLGLEVRPLTPDIDLHDVAVVVRSVIDYRTAEMADVAGFDARRAASEAQASLQGVEELTRLLHQFAGGTIGTPEPAVLSALRGAA